MIILFLFAIFIFCLLIYVLFVEPIVKKTKEEMRRYEARQLREKRRIAKANEEARKIKERQLRNERKALNYERQSILSDVRQQVWNRYQGRCAQCGSRYKLEFDHIIPVSKGGSNSVDNIQILCSECNRSKGSSIE